MASPDTAKPASGLSAEPVSGSEFLPGSKLSSDTPNASTSQAPPDNRGEDDETYFSRRPHVSTRTRLPFPNEFPAGVLEPGRGAFVHVLLVTRDPKTNAPATRARAIFYADNEEGRAHECRGLD